MNKAFVREPDQDGRAYCPQCGSQGEPVSAATLDAHVRPSARTRLSDSGWFCGFPRCDVAYFNQLESIITVDDLLAPVYPKDPSAPLCACFGFSMDEIEEDVREGFPRRIRELLAKSQSPEARCNVLAANGRCCMPQVQRQYMKLRGGM